jgi:hypothetical protein
MLLLAEPHSGDISFSHRLQPVGCFATGMSAVGTKDICRAYGTIIADNADTTG